MRNYLDVAVGTDARKHQARRGSVEAYTEMGQEPPPTGLGLDEVEFLTARDSVYLASVGENGWPYVQHRGGEPGFIRVLDPTHLAWAERSGNRQFVSAGNLDHDDRVSFIAVDYPNRQRMKVYGHARFNPSPTAEELAAIGFSGRGEGIVTVDVVSFAWNCPKYITPRFTAEQVRSVVETLQQRIAELEHQLSGTITS